MEITTVPFDFDGTLLPMETDVFIKKYFEAITKKITPYEYDKSLISGIWAGTEAMIKKRRDKNK